MFYQPDQKNHGLPHDPFKACVVPRPIGWISTVSRDGVVNLAPYSFFNAVCAVPPVVMFAANGRGVAGHKDSRTNAEETGEFVVNIATWELRERMASTGASVPPEVDELAMVGLTPAPSKLIRAPRVAESPVNFECRYLQTVVLPGEPAGSNAIILGQVIGIHIDERVLVDGRVDTSRLRAVGRLGYRDYCVIDSGFEIDTDGR